MEGLKVEKKKVSGKRTKRRKKSSLVQCLFVKTSIACGPNDWKNTQSIIQPLRKRALCPDGRSNWKFTYNPN